MEDRMCDKSSRVWCARVGLLVTVCTVLMTMMYQLWTYYFSLVSEMDQSSLESPTMQAMLYVCQQEIQRIWNVYDCATIGNHIQCDIEPFETKWYLDIVGDGRAFLNHSLSSIVIHPVDACMRVALWTFPW